MPATAGRVPMPAGNRVVTGNALKVSDRWSSIVGLIYASEKRRRGWMEKLWADQRLHGNKRKIGTDERGMPIFEMLNGAEEEEGRRHGREGEEYQLRREKEDGRGEGGGAGACRGEPQGEQEAQKDKKDKKDKKKKKKEKKEKEKKKKHKKEKKSEVDRSSSDSSSDSSSYTI